MIEKLMTIELLKRTLFTVFILSLTLTLSAQCEVDAGEDVTICQGDQVTLGGSPTVISGNNPSLDWNNGAADVDNPVVSPNSTTTYTVELSANGGCTDTDQITVTVLPAPNANFTWNNDGDCAGTPINFTNTSTGPGLEFEWDFGEPSSGGANTSTLEDPTHVFNPAGNGTTTFDVTLTVTGANGCSDSITQTITVQEAPNAVLADPVFDFVQCDGSGTFNLSVLDASTPASNTSYTIDWGDGSGVWTSGSAPVLVNHTYNGLGVWELTYTVVGTNGCTTVQYIDVSNVTNPAIGAGTTGNTTVCGPVELCFNLSLYESNHESTTYTVNFGDGSPTQTFTHPPPAQVCHTYSASSCAGGAAYVFSVIANNVCSFSEGTISPIVIYSPPTADFYATPVPQCVNVPVDFINLSQMGYYTNCGQNGTFIWNFGDGSGDVVVASNSDQSHVYTSPGTYTVTMTSFNACNVGTPQVATQEVCIEEPPTVAFDANPTTNCIPFTVNTNNNSTIGSICNVVYDWTLYTIDTECTVSSPNYQYVNGTDAASAEPSIEFLSPGQYQLELLMANSCGIYTDVQTIIAQDEPIVALDPIANICEGDAVVPVAFIEDCLAPITGTSWTFEQGTPGSSSSASPGSVQFNNAGTWDISLDVTNVCGTTPVATTVTVEPAPIVSIASTLGTELCAGESTNLTASGAVSYTWTYDPTLSTTNGANTTATPGSQTTYTVTGYSSAGCPGTQTITIDVNTLPSVLPSGSFEICQGDDIQVGVNVSGGQAPYVTYNWSPGATLSQTDIPDPIANPTSDTTYDVWVTDSNGCEGLGEVFVDVNPLPVVDAGPDVILCNQPVAEQLTGFSPTPGVGESGVWTGPNVDAGGVFTPTGVGTFDLTYTFIDANGCENQDMLTVEVVDPTMADAGPDLTFCETTVVELLEGVTPNGTWSGTNVLSDGTFTPSPAGLYVLTYSVGGGSCLSQDDIIVEVYELPVVDAGDVLEICAGDSIQLNGQVNGGELPYDTYTWSPSATLSDATILDPFADPILNETYTLDVVDDNGCVGTDDVDVIVNASPDVEAGPNIVLCNQPFPEQLTGFSPLPGVGETGEWTGPNIDAGGSFTPNGTGTFWVYYTFTNAVGCVAVDSLTVDVIDPTQANAGPDFDLCLNDDPVQLAQPGDWSGTDVTVTGLFTPAQDGVFTLTYTLGVGTCETTDDVEVTVWTLPVADAGLDATICAEGSVQLSGSGVSDNMPITTYEWTGGVGLDQTDVPDPVADPASTQTYTLTITDSEGCQGSDDVNVFVNQLPIVEAGPDITVCDQPIAEVLTGFSPVPVGAEMGEWTGTGITDPSGEFTSPGIGDYWVYYTFTDAVGCADVDSILITVVDPVVANAGPDQEICLNNGLYELQGFSPVNNINWSGTGIVDPALGTFDPLIAGVGTFTLTIEFGSGTCYTTDDMEITVDPLPVVEAGVPESACGNLLPFDLSGASPAGGLWEGTGIIDGINGTFDPAVGPGTYNVFYWYTEPSTGCADTTYKEVTVAPVPVADFIPAPLGCTNSNVDIDDFTSGATDWIWYWGNGDSTVSSTPLYIYPDPGFYDITLVAFNQFGCSDTLVQTNEIIDPPVTAFELLPSEGCAPLYVEFVNNSVGQDLTYEWDLSIMQTTDETPQPLTYQQGDDIVNYPIELIATNFCGSVMDQDTVTVFPQPVAGFGTNLDVDCSPFDVVFNNISTGNPDTYQWDFGDGLFSNMEEPGIHTFWTDTIAVDYTITLITTNECGIDTAEYTITVLPNTVTAFFNTNITEGCQPLEVEFTDFSEGGTVISYDFGDNSFTNNPNPTHVFTDPGFYTIYQYVNNGCSYDTTSIMVEVFPGPVLDFTTDVPNVCANQPVQFINLSEDVNNVSWDFGDNTTSDETNPIHTYTEGGGNYTVTLTGTSMFNECPGSTQQSFTVFNVPEASFEVDEQVGCSPFVVQFDNTTTGGFFYTWDFGDENTDNVLNPDNTFYNYTADPALYTVELIVENMQLCRDTAYLDIIVSPTPIAAFDLSLYESCYFPQFIEITNNTQFANGYQWDLGVLGTDDVVEPEFVIDADGTYPISLTATNSYGCSDSAQDEIVIHPLPEILFEVDAPAGCIDHAVNFVNFTDGATSYAWTFGDGDYSFADDPFHLYTEAGIYDVTLVATTDMGCVDTLVMEEFVQAYPLPSSIFTFEPEDPHVWTPGIQFEDLSFSAVAWQWDFGDGGYSNEQNPYHTYVDAGMYTIEQIVYNVYGCSDVSYRSIEVDDKFNLYVPNTFTPDEDGKNEVFLPQMSGKGLVEFYEFKIFDRWGIKIFETNDPDQPWVGDYMGPGDYYVQDDVYVWQIKVRLSNDDESRLYTGHVNILR
ncbi:MAG: PKD domain-containing protein [Flavobacteriales bacterium]|nr:PKD domain-containing protein [Flavobacteriales bacterium]